jgi:hypothetical protein
MWRRREAHKSCGLPPKRFKLGLIRNKCPVLSARSDRNSSNLALGFREFLAGSRRITSGRPCHRQNARIVSPVELHFVAFGSVVAGGLHRLARSRQDETVAGPEKVVTIQRTGGRVVVLGSDVLAGSDVTKKS